MIQQLMFGGVTTTTHTSQADGITAFFGSVTWRIEPAGSQVFTYTYSPGIPVSSSIQFAVDQINYPQKQMVVQINQGASDSVSTSGSNQTPTLSFSGVINSLDVYSSTTDSGGDDFSFSVLNIDGAQNYTKINSTTMSIP
mgnify:CR=1 FL=1|tara:strand:+ start:1074 stop:1493 length:420 start_codon:yes stop_codon:yes gene_type:complete